jgi:hypothetical protein
MQLEEMSKQFPNRRVALITFSDDVTLYGDARKLPVIVGGAKLNNLEELETVGRQYRLTDIGAIVETKKILSDKLFSLEEGGQTALGPALAVAVALATQQKGAEVIVRRRGKTEREIRFSDIALS